MTACWLLGHIVRLRQMGRELQAHCLVCARIFDTMEHPAWRLQHAPDSREKAEQREVSAWIIMEDCRENWMYGPSTPQGCTHTILREAVLKNQVPAGPMLPHQA